MVNFVIPRDFGSGLDFLAKAKSLRLRPQSQGQGQPIARPRPQILALRRRPGINITADTIGFSSVVDLWLR